MAWLGSECAAVRTDIARAATAGPRVGRAWDESEPLDGLVNKAGMIRRADAIDLSEADWDDVMDVNLKTAFLLCQAFARRVLASERLGKISGIHMRFDRPFFKEFTIQVRELVPALLSRLVDAGYHAGLHLGRWYPQFADCITVAVTEKRTRTEIDGLAAAYVNAKSTLIADASQKRSQPLHASSRGS